MYNYKYTFTKKEGSYKENEVTKMAPISIRVLP